MGEKPIADKLPLGCPIDVILEDGTTELHRRVLLDDLAEASCRERFVEEFNLVSKDLDMSDIWKQIVSKVEKMTMNEIKAFSGY
jgi:hypothetical protein